MSAMGRKRTLGQCLLWVESGRCSSGLKRRNGGDNQVQYQPKNNECYDEERHNQEGPPHEAFRPSILDEQNGHKSGVRESNRKHH